MLVPLVLWIDLSSLGAPVYIETIRKIVENQLFLDPVLLYDRLNMVLSSK